MYVAESDHRELEEIATAGLSQLSILKHHSAKNTCQIIAKFKDPNYIRKNRKEFSSVLGSYLAS